MVRSLAGSGAVRTASMLASFTVGVQLARVLGVAGYGYYGIAIAVITIASIPSELGIPRLITREVAASAAHGDIERLFGVLRWGQKTCLAMSLISASAVVAAALLVHSLRSPTLGAAMLAGSPIVVFMTLSRVCGGALQGLRHIVLGQVPANLFQPLLLSLLLLIATLAGLRIAAPGAMALNALSASGGLLVAHIWLNQRLPKSRRASLVRGGRRWIASSIPMSLTDGMRILQSELSTLLLGALVAPAAVGLFRIANVTALMAAAPIRVVGHVAMPVVAQLYAEGDSERLQKAVTALAWSGFAGVCLLSVPLLLFAEPLLRLVFGGNFVAAAGALRIILAGQIANAAFGPNAALLNMTHHERRVTRAMGAAAVLNAALVPLFAIFWGMTGGAVALVISLLCWNVLTWLDGRRLLQVETSILTIGWIRST